MKFPLEVRLDPVRFLDGHTGSLQPTGDEWREIIRRANAYDELLNIVDHYVNGCPDDGFGLDIWEKHRVQSPAV